MHPRQSGAHAVQVMLCWLCGNGQAMVHYGSVLPMDPPLEPAAYPFAIEVRARFAETDAMGVVHHSSYLAWLESARVEYLRSIGHPYLEVRASGLDFAVIDAALRYHRPVVFDELVTVFVGFGAMTRASFRMNYLLTVDGERRTSAQTGHAAVDAHTGELRRLPSWLVERARA